MIELGFIKVLVRELVRQKQQSQRIPEPDLIMDNEEKVKAYIRSGKEDGVMAPTYLFHCAQVCEIIKPGDTVIDLACGPATQLGLIARLNPESQFIGIDLSDEMLERADEHIKKNKLNNISLQKGDITDIKSTENNSADTVISTMSLHHLPTLKLLDKTFQEIQRIIKEDGAIYLTDFGHLKADKSIDFFAYKYKSSQPELFTLDYLNSMKAAFSLADFQLLTEKYLSNQAQLYSTFVSPFMIAIKSQNKVQLLEDSAVAGKLSILVENLPKDQKNDLRDLKQFFAAGGLKSKLLKVL